MMATASTSAATMNILTCSMFGEFRLTRGPLEEVAAQDAEADGGAGAPMPIMMPAAITVALMS